MDDDDKTKRRARSSGNPDRLLGEAIRADAAEARRRKAAEAEAAAEAERVVERAEMEEAIRVAAEAERREAAEKRMKAREECGPCDDYDSDADSERDDEEVPDRPRLKGIPEIIKMPKHAESKLPRITDGRTWMTPEILTALTKRVGFSGCIEFRIPKEHERPYDAPPAWICVYECFFTEYGMKFPLPFLLLRFASERGVAVSQLTHGVFRHMVFTEALAKAANVTFDRYLFENVTDLRAGSKWEGSFKRFHTAMRHRIVFGNYRDKIPDWKRYFFFVKISKASVGNFKSEQIKTDWVSSPDPLRRARPSTALKNKFNALRDLSHRIWPEVVEKLEREKRERKERKEGRSKPAVPVTPVSTRSPRLKKKPMGLRKRTAVPIDDVVIVSEPAFKKKRVGSPRSRDSPSPSLRSSSIASRTRASARRTSSSAPKKVPEGVVELDSPPSDRDGNASRRDESAPRHDDDVMTPPCGTSPVQEEEFLTYRDDGPSFNRGGGLGGDESRRRPDDKAVSRRSEAHGSAPEPNLDAKDDSVLPKPEPEDYNPHAFKMRWSYTKRVKTVQTALSREQRPTAQSGWPRNDVPRSAKLVRPTEVSAKVQNHSADHASRPGKQARGRPRHTPRQPRTTKAREPGTSLAAAQLRSRTTADAPSEPGERPASGREISSAKSIRSTTPPTVNPSDPDRSDSATTRLSGRSSRTTVPTPRSTRSPF
ncbi:unnamed protein product [Microthlaspi erraticum]|uniref:Uncharacterized protein n=1 Tax=Microthlaspi erraticum TaxID=1685480 RepID=A0A6D2IZG2_9BRAS|nr:unnamed protein product [Microthlaspi erraticum]